MSESKIGSARPSWDRDRHLRLLGERVYDLLVIGGGATGCSVARDAALRGLDVCLVERDDLASGASSRSTRFIHGGLRYLRSREFGFVREGLEERRNFLEIAPHLVRPAQFLFPSYRGGRPGRWGLRFGIAIYDFLARGNRVAPSRLLGPSETLGLEPGLRSDGLTGSVVYGDAVTDDARLVIETALGAVEAGATLAIHVEVERLIPSDSGPALAILRDRLTGEPLGTRAGVVINATGAGIGSIAVVPEKGVDRKGPATLARLRPSRGSHLVVAREDCPVSRIVVIPNRRDGRLLFAVPAGEFTYLGTTEVVHDSPPGEVRADSAEVEYLREAAAEIFESGPLPRNRILSTWAGIRPLIDRKGFPSGDLPRDFRIFEQAPGVVAVAGGKLTTCRRMAEAAVDFAASILSDRFGKGCDGCITRWKLFPGAEGSARTEESAAPAELDPTVARHLDTTYGTRARRILLTIAQDPSSGVPLAPGCPATPAEAAHAVEEEGAVRLADLIFRRLHPHFLEARMGTDQGRRILEGASRVMASRLGWAESQRLEEIERARDEWRRSFSVPDPAG